MVPLRDIDRTAPNSAEPPIACAAAEGQPRPVRRRRGCSPPPWLFAVAVVVRRHRVRPPPSWVRPASPSSGSPSPGRRPPRVRWCRSMDEVAFAAKPWCRAQHTSRRIPLHGARRHIGPVPDTVPHRPPAHVLLSSAVHPSIHAAVLRGRDFRMWSFRASPVSRLACIWRGRRPHALHDPWSDHTGQRAVAEGGVDL